MRYILNSAVITSEGIYSYKRITVEEAKEWIKKGPYISTIGYEETALVLSEMLGIKIDVNRIVIEMEKGDEALVFRIVLPKGSPRIDPKDKGMIMRVIENKYWEMGILRRLE